MFKTTMFALFGALLITALPLQAQEEKTEMTPAVKARLERLEKVKAEMLEEERSLLKQKVEEIDKQLADGLITAEQAKDKKEEAALVTARNIENRTAIIENKMELVKRGEFVTISDDPEEVVYRKRERRDRDEWYYFGDFDCFSCHEGWSVSRRTKGNLVIAAGFSNALVDGGSLDDSPYKIGGSRFFEIGWQFKTRVFEDTNWLRLVYGINFQFNGFKPEDDRYFVRDGDLTLLEPFDGDLKKSKLRMDNLVIPVYFEMGPSRRIESNDRVRFSTHRKFRVGLGGYAGLNYTTRHKLKYKIDGERTKEKIKNSFNTSNTVYGLAGYIGFGDLTLYGRYGLNTIFKDPNPDQHEVAFGLRWEL